MDFADKLNRELISIRVAPASMASMYTRARGRWSLRHSS